MEQVQLKGGPLDGQTRPVPPGPDGQPPERFEFEQQAADGLWYVEYQRGGHGSSGWSYQATGNAQRADEE